MSTVSRLISGSGAAWVQIAIVFMSQMALVPVYLSFWNVQTYGIWLAVQALIFFMSIFDRGHMDFLGFEFLRLGNGKRVELGLYLWSGVWFGAAIGLLQIIFIIVLLVTKSIQILFDETVLANASIIKDASIVLLLQSIAWLFSGSVNALFNRALWAFGYYPRMAWWGVFSYLLIALAPVIAVILGAGLLTAGIVTACTTVIVSIPQCIDMLRLLRKEKIFYGGSSIKLGWQNFLRSLALSLKYILENFRQQGIRIILAPLAGAVGLAAFSTMRTGANVASQGLNSVANPLMPELMRFLHRRDQPRSDAALGIVWIIVIAILAPAVIVLQVIMEPLFLIWTRGKVPFEPLLFATLSAGVLVYGVAQPALAIVYGNNLLKSQLLISISAAIAVIGGTFILVPKIGILGAGFALLAAELVAAAGNMFVARRWLRQNGLLWSRRLFTIVSISIVIAAFALITVIYLPEAKWLILSVSMLLLLGNLWLYWKALPAFATQHARQIVVNLFSVKKLRAT